MADYTKTWHEYESGGLPPSLSTKFAQIPNFKFIDTNLNINLSISFYALFQSKYYDREICITDELGVFEREANYHLNRAIIEYVPKISMWINNFNELFKFSVKLNIDTEREYSNDNKNTYYLNPVTSITEHLRTQDVNTTDNSGNSNIHIEREVLQTVWGKTRANILEQIMKLESIYTEMLDSLNNLFMEIY